jgi:hypothetical protein
MPATFDRAFNLWLTQHGSERAAAVNVLEFLHPKWGSVVVSDYGETFTALRETGVQFVAQPLGFTIDVAADNVSTEQRVVIRMDNANGAVADQLRSLTDEDLQTAVLVVYRVYLDSDLDSPQIDPLSLYVTGAQLTRLVVEVEASADTLPNVGAGTRYTIDNFRPLIYL